jgi:chemotaxis methyl-accepting protein methylase
MVAHVERVTGFNRHPSLLEVLEDSVLPLFTGIDKLKIASVPCATGAESLAIAMQLEKSNIDYIIQGFDVDISAVNAARNGVYFVNQRNSQIEGDPSSGYTYNFSNLTNAMIDRIFDHCFVNERSAVKVKEEIASRLVFSENDILGASEDSYDIIFCCNFLKYTIDEQYSGLLPSLDTVTHTLCQATKDVGALMIEPKADKSACIQESLFSKGYMRVGQGAYLKT